MESEDSDSEQEVSKPSPEYDKTIQWDLSESPKVEGYDIVDKIGEGGMGTVWRALQLGTRREVALKLIGGFSGGVESERFRREIEYAAKLNHPNIARVFDGGLDKQLHYYSMELIDGVAFTAWTDAEGCTLDEALELTSKTCRAMAYAHDQGVAHLDLKPSNILVDEDGEPHILDFGLAAEADALQRGNTVTLTISGTLGFMAPEQAAGDRELDFRADIFSMGAVLFLVLTGRRIIEDDQPSVTALAKLVGGDILDPQDVDPGMHSVLAEILRKALATRPEDRYGSLLEMADALDRFRVRYPKAGWGEHRGQKPVEEGKPKRHRGLLLVLVVVVALLLAGGALGLLLHFLSKEGWDLHRVRPVEVLALDFSAYPDSPEVFRQVQVDYAEEHDLPLEIETRVVGLRMVLIPPGTYVMGSDEELDDLRQGDERRKIVVIEKPFYMSKYEITQKIWNEVMPINPSSSYRVSQGPVQNLTWDEAQTFLVELAGVEGVSQGRFRLPTEEEWEWACRAGTTTRFYFGEDLALLHRFCNFCGSECSEHSVGGDDGHAMLCRVGQYPPNPWGLHDMMGNVAEFVGGYYLHNMDRSIVETDIPGEGHLREIRGGGFNSPPLGVRSADRNWVPFTNRIEWLGFRVTMRID